MTEPVRPNELRAFFAYVIDVLERLDIPYMVVGGFAAIFYGEPRLTLDVDIVIDMKPAHIRPFVAAFPIPDYYVSEEAIRDSLRRRFPFNVIQPFTGAKVDLVPLPRDLFSRTAFERRQRMEYDAEGHSAAFIRAEDLVVAKLVAFRETQSDKHLRDARGILTTQWGRLDLAAIRRQAAAAGVSDAFERALAMAQEEAEGE
jgi:hypothetical protein